LAKLLVVVHNCSNQEKLHSDMEMIDRQQCANEKHSFYSLPLLPLIFLRENKLRIVGLKKLNEKSH
jgi:hypothetical protein